MNTASVFPRILCVGATVFGLLAGEPAFATTITLNFDNLKVQGNGIEFVDNGIISRDGYIFTEYGPGAFYAVEKNNPLYTGQPAILNSNGNNGWGYGAVTTLTQSNGSAFDIFSIALAPTWTSRGRRGIDFFGIQADGHIFEQRFELAGDFYKLVTFSFDQDFTDLTSLSWLPDSGHDTIVQFDDLVLATTGPAAVPEPSGIALCGAALLGLGLIRYRRRRAPTAEA